MLSKKGFRHHLDNIENQAKWAEYYKEFPKLENVPIDSLNNSKKVLLEFFDEVEPLKEENEALFETSKLNADLAVRQENIIKRYEQALKKVQQQLCASVKPHLILEDINKFSQSEFLKRNEDN